MHSHAEINYVSVSNQRSPKSLREIWEEYHGIDQNPLWLTRMFLFPGALLILLSHALIVRKLPAPPAESYRGALRALPCLAVFGYALLVAVALWLLPVVLCWAGTFPDVFVKLVGVQIVAAALARWVLACGYQRARERAERAAQSANAERRESSERERPSALGASLLSGTVERRSSDDIQSLPVRLQPSKRSGDGGGPTALV